MAQLHGRRYIRAFVSGFFVAVPVTVTFLDRVACIARVEGVSMQPSLNPGGKDESDVVLLNRWSIRNYEVQRGDVVSLVASNSIFRKTLHQMRELHAVFYISLALISYCLMLVNNSQTLLFTE
ncbi:mitochondrial inner membrane protease subunit 2 isoform X5 [Mixophyes fleayi]|uniref:mitochondrial inner membrane protease subunit 2 isoform X5 n=1 Tax=Mixophyes fleayi TaxID=3061075 RepID=UPI003F4D8F12